MSYRYLPHISDFKPNHLYLASPLVGILMSVKAFGDPAPLSPYTPQVNPPLVSDSLQLNESMGRTDQGLIQEAPTESTTSTNALMEASTPKDRIFCSNESVKAALNECTAWTKQLAKDTDEQASASCKLANSVKGCKNRVLGTVAIADR